MSYMLNSHCFCNTSIPFAYFEFYLQIFPIIFVLMDKRTTNAYNAVFNFINVKVFDMRCTKKFYTDYEIAIRNSLRINYPASKLLTCNFHQIQAIRKKASQIEGFMEFIKQNDAARKIYYKIMYLGFLNSKFTIISR